MTIMQKCLDYIRNSYDVVELGDPEGIELMEDLDLAIAEEIERKRQSSDLMMFKIIRRGRGTTISDWRRGTVMYSNEEGALIKTENKTKWYPANVNEIKFKQIDQRELDELAWNSTDWKALLLNEDPELAPIKRKLLDYLQK